ncbi:fibulin-1-like isoform X2 [Ischnura elegans]|uniref:fibulin-1-like isoform X2 n=1 Tax=Ischnura elegans TaxID=197161 RepID=UPI001ED88389|nr:fibulin-1-like isoform X2 [Ischnura elegans]
MDPLIFVPLLLLLGSAAAGDDLEATLSQCCELGSTWAGERLKCSAFPSPVAGVQAEQQSICLATVDICCLRAHRNSICEDGKNAAKAGQECKSAPELGGEYQKYCCEACKLGLISGSMATGCQFKDFAFGPPWDLPYSSCCSEASPTTPLAPTTPVAVPPLVTRPPGSKGKPIAPRPPVLINLCDSFPGQLCAHICKPTRGSYICECRNGFTLMADGKSCEQNDYPDRCKTNSPCAHRCFDTGIAIECSCNPGYQLGPDERSCIEIKQDAQPQPSEIKPLKCPPGFIYNPDSQVCDDVDECREGLDNCSRGQQFCMNMKGSFTCVDMNKRIECLAGYKYNAATKDCEDVNECEEDIHGCIPETELCRNTAGAYECDAVCDPGFIFNERQQSCEDINECEDSPPRCNPKEVCINTNGSFSCLAHVSPPVIPNDPSNRCAAGFRYNVPRQLCMDIDECSENIHVCSKSTEICINEPGGYRCSSKNLDDAESECPSGYQKLGAYEECIDINECLEASEIPCDSNQDCENTPGSYICLCKRGFQMDPITQACTDVNECQVGSHDCTSSQRCDNTIGSFQCIRFTSCGTGYTLNAHTGLCEDDDECSLKTDNCAALGPLYECRNTLGSFRCDRKKCGPNMILSNSGQCINVQCPKGYQAASDGQCNDIDECALGNPCKRNQRCLNTLGSYKCVNFLSCRSGHELNEAGTHCVDIDECARGTHDCSPEQTCQNRAGGYVCQCPAGFTRGAGKKCVDIDECARYADKVCSINSVCQNTPGSYKCLCKPGFKEGPDGITCEDVDECTENSNVCQQKCLNAWGSYRCTCNPGFTLHSDNRTCRDIDECQIFKHNRLCIGNCVNDPGSYHCTCPSGYKLGGDGRSCQDIDECSIGNPCAPDEICIDTRGDYRCNSIICPPGYIRDRDHKNRCKRAALYCREGDIECLRLPSTYVYNFISFVSNIPIPSSGQLDLFTMTGSLYSKKSVQFHYDMINARAEPGISRASKEFFKLRRTAQNQAVISLVRPILGPQEIELQLSMEVYHEGIIGGSFVAKIYIYVSRYEF